jgi:hypothetical protein
LPAKLAFIFTVPCQASILHLDLDPFEGSAHPIVSMEMAQATAQEMA